MGCGTGSPPSVRPPWLVVAGDGATGGLFSSFSGGISGEEGCSSAAVSSKEV